jgi:hypothetical protein
VKGGVSYQQEQRPQSYLKENTRYFLYECKSDDEKNKFNTEAMLRHKGHQNFLDVL